VTPDKGATEKVRSASFFFRKYWGDKYGEELCAWIQLRDGAEPLDAEAIRAFASGKLAHYKIPRYLLVVDEFPMTVTRKICKVEMRERSLTELGPG
jgi:fatty-acyl-CoA synthase